ncbi:MAG: sel1 repeat family protein, partial [Desulfovibrio sp.]|nr:sel1 repeat family protein [Desulfovibrio sp.]
MKICILAFWLFFGLINLNSHALGAPEGENQSDGIDQAQDPTLQQENQASEANPKAPKEPNTELEEIGKELSRIQVLLDQKNYTEAVKALKPLVAKENPEAMYVLGHLTHEGQGLKASPRAAAELYRKAALKEDLRACVAWAKALASGDGVKRNLREAAKWFRKAAEQGVAIAE